jgi:hypothetical protein
MSLDAKLTTTVPGTMDRQTLPILILALSSQLSVTAQKVDAANN